MPFGGIATRGVPTDEQHRFRLREPPPKYARRPNPPAAATQRDKFLGRTESKVVGLLVSGGLDSCILLKHLLDAGRTVKPFYIRSGLWWQDAEQGALGRYLDAVAVRRLEPLAVLELPLGDVYGDHWSITGRDIPAAGTPDEAVYLPGAMVPDDQGRALVPDARHRRARNCDAAVQPVRGCERLILRPVGSRAERDGAATDPPRAPLRRTRKAAGDGARPDLSARFDVLLHRPTRSGALRPVQQVCASVRRRSASLVAKPQPVSMLSCGWRPLVADGPMHY